MISQRNNGPRWSPQHFETARAFDGKGGIRALAKQLGVSRQTVYNWINEHPGFLDAIKA